MYQYKTKLADRGDLMKETVRRFREQRHAVRITTRPENAMCHSNLVWVDRKYITADLVAPFRCTETCSTNS